MVSRVIARWILIFTAALQVVSINTQTQLETRISDFEASQIHDSNVDILAKLVYGEARGCSTTEQAAVIWCVLNRVDAGYADGTIWGVVTQKGQFTGYRATNPVLTTHRELAIDVLKRWYREKRGVEDVGRVLPKAYKYFSGDGKHNYFRPEYNSPVRWDWSLPSPYGN